MVAVAARTKNGHITGFIQRADYMKGEIEAVSSVDAVYDEDTVWQTEEQMLLKESMIEQTEIYEKENNENEIKEKLKTEENKRVTIPRLFLCGQILLFGKPGK